MQTKIILMSYVICALLISSCANTDIYRGDVYTHDRAKRVQSVRFGTIIATHPVKIQAKQTGVGTGTGASLAGIAGSHISNSYAGSMAGGIVGSVVGGIIGSKIEEKATQVESLELTIALDDGGNIVVVQKSQPGLVTGAKVRVVTDGSDVNVNPM